MLVDKFIKFLGQIRCKHYSSIVSNKGKTMEITINGAILKDKLEEFLQKIYEQGKKDIGG